MQYVFCYKAIDYALKEGGQIVVDEIPCKKKPKESTSKKSIDQTSKKSSDANSQKKSDPIKGSDSKK